MLLLIYCNFQVRLGGWGTEGRKYIVRFESIYFFLEIGLSPKFSHELSEPLSCIFNNITKSGIWPEHWKLEYGIPLKKTKNPVNEDNLRIISLTPLYSKTYEKIVLEWLLEYLKDKIDMFQYGGQKGNAVSHTI